VADRAALNATKLRALARSRWGDGQRQSHTFPGGAALTEARDGRIATAWVLLDALPERGLGPALVLADRLGAGELHLIADDETGLLARRASAFSPAPEVWAVDGTSVVRAEPAPLVPAIEARPVPDLAGVLIDHDLEVVVEDGIVRGEVLGLEVARIAVGETTAGVPIDEPLLEVGVGRADRELTAMVHGDLAPVAQLERVIEIVRAVRRAGAPPHPLNRLVPERWLRAVVVAEPGRIGLARLEPAPPAVPRRGLREPSIAVARGAGLDGGEVVVAASVGVDLDLVPAAADARAALASDADLWLVVPERDDVPATRTLAARLARPATVVPIAGDWRA
jgi:hypothetical protein